MGTENQASLLLIKKRQRDPTPLFQLLDIDVRGCDLWTCSSNLVTKRWPWQIKDARVERQEATQSSVTAELLKQPWDYILPDFSTGGKKQVLERTCCLWWPISCSGHTGAQHFSATKAWPIDLKCNVTRSIVAMSRVWLPTALPCSGNQWSTYTDGVA